MTLKFKRALNAFAIGVGATLGGLLIADQKPLADAITVGDWTSLRILIVPIIVGAIAGGIRALQSKVKAVPSPEPEENAPAA